jgi:hypothetical protein
MGDEETLRGAVNRVNNARKLRPDADYYWGMEGERARRRMTLGLHLKRSLAGGCVEMGGTELGCCAWIVVCTKDNRWGKARTGVMQLWMY